MKAIYLEILLMLSICLNMACSKRDGVSRNQYYMQTTNLLSICPQEQKRSLLSLNVHFSYFITQLNKTKRKSEK